jgi:hypothetical protein
MQIVAHDMSQQKHYVNWLERETKKHNKAGAAKSMLPEGMQIQREHLFNIPQRPTYPLSLSRSRWQS